MLRVILYSDQPEFNLEAALQDAASWIEQRTGRRCPWTLTRRPALVFSDDPYRDIVVDLVDVRHDPPGRYVVLARGIGGFAGGTIPRDGYGVGLLGDWCLDALIGGPGAPDNPDWARNVRPAGRNGQIGALLHEWLHGYGFVHEDSGIMSGDLTRWPATVMPAPNDAAWATLLADLEPIPVARLPWWRWLLAWIRR